MVAAASIADVAIVAIDARRGLEAQVRRQSHLASRFGTPTIVVAVNKLDLVGYAQDVFDRIAAQFLEFARATGMRDVTCIPTCALTGENVTRRGPDLSWYRGPTLLERLDVVRAADAAGATPPQPFRMTVDAVAAAGTDPIRFPVAC